MAATLASVCSVPLTSVLLLFELTKDYRILLPLMVVSNAFSVLLYFI
jgi:chloride channel protein, CIC family